MKKLLFVFAWILLQGMSTDICAAQQKAPQRVSKRKPAVHKPITPATSHTASKPATARPPLNPTPPPPPLPPAD